MVVIVEQFHLWGCRSGGMSEDGGARGEGSTYVETVVVLEEEAMNDEHMWLWSWYLWWGVDE